MKHRFLIEELNTMTDNEILSILVNERQNSLSNPYSPLSQRLQKISNTLDKHKEQVVADTELLEACKEVQQILENQLGEWLSVSSTYAPEWTHKIKDILEKVEQAIAKAEGR